MGRYRASNSSSRRGPFPSTSPDSHLGHPRSRSQFRDGHEEPKFPARFFLAVVRNRIVVDFAAVERAPFFRFSTRRGDTRVRSLDAMQRVEPLRRLQSSAGTSGHRTRPSGRARARLSSRRGRLPRRTGAAEAEEADPWCLCRCAFSGVLDTRRVFGRGQTSLRLKAVNLQPDARRAAQGQRFGPDPAFVGISGVTPMRVSTQDSRVGASASSVGACREPAS